MTDSANPLKFWGPIDDLETASREVKAGRDGAYICCAVTVAFVVAGGVGILSVSQFRLAALIDAAAFAALGWGISRHSRVCAGIALCLYLWEQLDNIGSLGVGISFLGFVVTIFLIRGLRGTFAYRRLEGHQSLEPPSDA